MRGRWVEGQPHGSQSWVKGETWLMQLSMNAAVKRFVSTSEECGLQMFPIGWLVDVPGGEKAAIKIVMFSNLSTVICHLQGAIF